MIDSVTVKDKWLSLDSSATDTSSFLVLREILKIWDFLRSSPIVCIITNHWAPKSHVFEIFTWTMIVIAIRYFVYRTYDWNRTVCMLFRCKHNLPLVATTQSRNSFSFFAFRFIPYQLIWCWVTLYVSIFRDLSHIGHECQRRFVLRSWTHNYFIAILSVIVRHKICWDSASTVTGASTVAGASKHLRSGDLLCSISCAL